MEFNYKMIDVKRYEKGITVKDFCNKLDINTSTYRRWINGDIKPKFETVVKACKILNIDINNLVGGI